MCLPFDPDEVLPAREVFRRLSAQRRAARQKAAEYGPTRVYTVAEYVSPRGRMISERQELRHARQGATVGAICEIQRGRCYLCQEAFGRHRPPTVEHVTPKVLGGRTYRNILLACHPCNSAKADRLPTPAELAYLAEVNAALLNTPYFPLRRNVR